MLKILQARLQQYVNCELPENEGETVLDNCMGSGSTGIACLKTNRNFIGIEKEVKYFNIAKERIENFESLMITDW